MNTQREKISPKEKQMLSRVLKTHRKCTHKKPQKIITKLIRDRYTVYTNRYTKKAGKQKYMHPKTPKFRNHHLYAVRNTTLFTHIHRYADNISTKTKTKVVKNIHTEKGQNFSHKTWRKYSRQIKNKLKKKHTTRNIQHSPKKKENINCTTIDIKCLFCNNLVEC